MNAGAGQGDFEHVVAVGGDDHAGKRVRAGEQVGAVERCSVGGDGDIQVSQARAFPVKLAVMVPAEKLPEGSRLIRVSGVLTVVAAFAALASLATFVAA